MLDCFLVIIAMLLLFNLYLIIKSGDNVLDYVILAIILLIIYSLIN